MLRVPFADALTCMLDAGLPLTEHERDEWGDPAADADAFGQLRATCPYQGLLLGNPPTPASTETGGNEDGPAAGGTVTAAAAAAADGSRSTGQRLLLPPCLPPVLVSCSLDDARVPFWAAAKWVAAARQQGQQMPRDAHGLAGEVLLRIRENGGHSGNPEQQAEELAEDYAFLITALRV